VTTGVGIHATASAAMLEVKEALLSVFQTALDGQAVDVRIGFVWPSQHPDEVSLTRLRYVPADATVSTNRRRQGQVSVDVEIWAYRVTADERVTHSAAFGILEDLEAAVMSDPTLGGKALWCFVGETDSDGITTGDELGQGRATGIVATFEAQVIVSK